MGCVKSKLSIFRSCVVSKFTKVTPNNNVREKFNVDKQMDSLVISQILTCAEFKEFNWGFENLVIEGAGTNGTVTIGAYKVLEKVGILPKIKRFVGTSSGSMVSTFAAVRMPASVMEKAFLYFNMEEIKDDSFGILRDLSRLATDYGFYKGDVLEEFIETELEKHTGISKITFAQVKSMYKSMLYITRTNLSQLRIEYLSADTHPDMPVSEAVRQSASIPFVFKAPISEHRDIISDGGIGAPYPIDLFDENTSFNGEQQTSTPYNKKTIGLKIMNPKTEQRNALIRTELGFEITNIIEFIETFIAFQTIMVERLTIKPGYWERTITLESPGRHLADFDISLRSKYNEIHQGVTDTIIALAKYVDEGRF